MSDATATIATDCTASSTRVLHKCIVERLIATAGADIGVIGATAAAAAVAATAAEIEIVINAFRVVVVVVVVTVTGVVQVVVGVSVEAANAICRVDVVRGGVGGCGRGGVRLAALGRERVVAVALERALVRVAAVDHAALHCRVELAHAVELRIVVVVVVVGRYRHGRRRTVTHQIGVDGCEVARRYGVMRAAATATGASAVVVVVVVVRVRVGVVGVVAAAASSVGHGPLSRWCDWAGAVGATSRLGAGNRQPIGPTATLLMLLLLVVVRVRDGELVWRGRATLELLVGAGSLAAARTRELIAARAAHVVHAERVRRAAR